MKNFLRNLKVCNTKLSKKGFSMAEVMAATAILGIVVVATISQLNLSSKSALDMAADAEINSLTNKIISSIGTPAVCIENFQNKLQGSTLSPTDYNSLINNGTVLVQKGTSLGTSAGEVQVSAITTKAVSDNEMILTVTFNKKKFGVASYFGQGTKREIPINTVLIDPTGTPGDKRISYCFANYDLVVKTAIQQACKGNSSHYDETVNPPYGNCVHAVQETPKCANGEFLKRIRAVDGSIQYTCGKITDDCPNGQAIKAFNPDGSVVCDYLFKTCAPGEVIVKNAAGEHVCSKIDCDTPYSTIYAFSGFDSNGVQVCQPVTTANDCGTGYTREVQANGTIKCSAAAFVGGDCGVGKFVKGVDIDGQLICEQIITFPKNCNDPTTEAITGVDSNGDITCLPADRPLACGGSTKSYRDCKAAGGTIARKGLSDSHCVFTMSACPSGWNQCNSYAKQQNKSCTDTSNTSYCDSNRITRTASSSAGNNVYADVARASVTCVTWTGAPNTSHACAQVPQTATLTDITQIGCK